MYTDPEERPDLSHPTRPNLEFQSSHQPVSRRTLPSRLSPRVGLGSYLLLSGAGTSRVRVALRAIPEEGWTICRNTLPPPSKARWELLSALGAV